jgi:zinc/manganese transport system substrate-binding protein
MASLTVAVLAACGSAPTNTTVTAPAAANGVFAVVAAENFYGDVARQIGGEHVAVISIMADPNVDPHEYESNVQDGIALQKAQLVIQNGLGYDTWMDKLLSASPNPNRVVLVAGDIADHKLPDNPHVWYGIDNMQTIAQAIASALIKLDGANAETYNRNLATFKQSLLALQDKIAAIHQKYNGTPVALTETIYLYQTGPEGLKVLTPFAFQKAIAEGNDPPADAVVEVNNEITQKNAKVLIYNSQTVTPVTSKLQDEARTAGIPVVPVSESMPSGKTYQGWMMEQLNSLELALAGTAGQ